MDQVSKIKPGLGRGLDALISPNVKMSDQNLTISSKEIKQDDGQSFEILVKMEIDNTRHYLIDYSCYFIEFYAPNLFI